jgi:serine/threonine-protein kinase ATR
LLRQVIYATPQQTFDEETSPSHFQDEEVKRAVESLHLSYGQISSSNSVTKRRRVIPLDSDPLLNLFKAIYEAFDMGWTGDEPKLMPEEIFL